MTDVQNSAQPTHPTGTIDITNAIEAVRSAFVTWATAFIYGEELAIPGMQWVALPVISALDKDIIEEVLNLLSKSSIMLVFFENTVIRKASQAQDFVDVVAIKNNLPPTASDEEYEKAEQAQMLAFRNFVLVTN